VKAGEGTSVKKKRELASGWAHYKQNWIEDNQKGEKKRMNVGKIETL